MPTLVELKDVNQFLPKDKLTLTENDREPELEGTAKSIVLSSLAIRFDASEWITAATTPTLVKSVIGMFVAGWIYDRQYGEDGEGISYGSRLVEQANDLLRGLREGSLSLEDQTIVQMGHPSYHESDPVFVMGKVF